jgi:hypothetical protein
MNLDHREFFYKKGRVSTSIPWTRPSPDRISQLINYALPKTDQLGLDLYIMGRCLIDMNSTIDLDMFVAGSIEDQQLEDLLHELLDYSLNQQRMLLDMAWSGVIVPFEEKNSELCFKNNTLKVLDPWQLGTGTKAVIKDGPTLLKNATRITDYMIEVHFDNTYKLSKKHIESLKINKNYFGIPAKEWMAKWNQ